MPTSRLVPVSYVPSSSYVPSRPTSVRSFLGNRAIAVWKITISGLGAAVSSATCLFFFIGSPKKRATRAAFAAAAFFQGIRQFLYTKDVEEPKALGASDGDSYGKRVFTTLHIIGIGFSKHGYDSSLYNTTFALKKVAYGIFGFRVNEDQKKIALEEQQKLTSLYIEKLKGKRS